MVLEIINSGLSHQLQHNPNLLYTLLYKKSVFEPFRKHHAFEDIVNNIDAVSFVADSTLSCFLTLALLKKNRSFIGILSSQVINYFTSKLEQVNSELGENEVLATIQHGALQWPRERLKVGYSLSH